MNILQLNLIAFGSFSDKTLDFSTGAPGFHLLYGMNEAGKSTLRRALIHLFFGIPERTTDAYLHANDKLRIGAKLLDNTGNELNCFRRKGRKNTLLDEHNQPLNEEHLQALLGNMNLSQFTALSCFDHASLRQGGEDLLDSGGDVGESLFEAGTGALKVHEVLTALDHEKNEIFKARGSRPVLNKKIRDYKEACKRILETSLSAEKWTEQAKKLDEVQQRHSQLTEQLQKLRAEQHRLERIQRTRPRLKKRQELTIELSSLASIILLADNAATEHIQTKIALRTATAQEQQTQQDTAYLQQQIDAIEISHNLIEQKAIIDDLRERLGSYQKAARDLPGVRTEMRTVENEASSLLRHIYPNINLAAVASELVISKSQREYLKKLAVKAPSLHEKQASIENRLSELKNQLVERQQTLNSLAKRPDLTLLQVALVRACKYTQLEETYGKNSQEVNMLRENIEISLKQIGWSSDLETLETIPLPKMERIDYFYQRFAEIENDQKRIKERLLEARQRNENTTQKINALSWVGEIPTEETLIQARQTREQHWQKIKKFKLINFTKEKSNRNLSLFDIDNSHTYPFDSINTQTKEDINDDKIFDVFEETMLYSDELSDRLRREAKRVAEYSMLLAEQKSAKTEQEQQTKKWHTVEALLANLQKEWEDSWKTTNIKPWTPTEMRDWLNEALNLRQQITLLRTRYQQLQEQKHLISALCQEITQALTPLQTFIQGQILTRLPDLIDQGNHCADSISQLQRQGENLQLEIDNLTKEQQQVEIAQQKNKQSLQQWQKNWEKALIPLKLTADTPPETARNILNDLDQIFNKVDKISGLSRRVKLMQKDAKLFKQEVGEIIQKIAPNLVDDTIEQAIPTLASRLNQTEKDQIRLEQLQQRLHSEQQRLTDVKQQIHISQAHLQVLLEQAHCDNLVDLEAAEQASSYKKQLQQDLIDIEEQLLQDGEGMSLDDLERAATSIEIDELPVQLQNCVENITQLEQERSNIDQNIGELRTLLKQMDGNDQAAQAADEAQLALAEVQDLSKQYIRVHLAASVLRKSIDRYREQNQAPVIKRASILFQQLTLNSFSGLKIDYSGQNDQPILVGLRTADNSSIPTAGMSDGSRDQLYLALRLASIERYIEKNTPIPLTLDDILINFDDERAKITLKILGELCQKTQIIFLTHHTRLAELALTAIPKQYLVQHQL